MAKKDVYIDEDGSGNITGVYARKQRQGQKKLKEDNARVVAFLNSLRASDPNEEKVYEEMRALAVQSLIGKGELPPDYV